MALTDPSPTLHRVRGRRVQRQAVAAGERNAARVQAAMQDVFAAEPAVDLEYVALVDPETLVAVTQLQGATLAAVAARVGKTRLIDNELLNV